MSAAAHRRPLRAALLAVLTATLLTPTARAQGAAPEALAFDTVSIHHDAPGSGGGRSVPDRITPTGWHMDHTSLLAALLTAYVPTTPDAMMYTTGTLSGLPDWIRTEAYTIDARVSEAGLAAWQNPANQPALLRSMLQTMLADRCKLIAHRAPRETAVYILLPGKGGPKLQPATSTKPHSGGYPLPGGGEFVQNDGAGNIRFYNAPITAMTVVLANVTNRPVEDHTGLTGHYDLTFRRPRMGPAAMDPTSTDPAPTIFEVIEDLGLKLESGKAPVETLFIDHIERPSEN